MELTQYFLDLLPQIGKYLLIALSGILADRGLKKIQAFRKKTQAASETVIDVDKMIITYHLNMKRSSEALEEERGKRISIKKKYDELEVMYHNKAHESGRFATYTFGTIQLLKAHNKVCDCSNNDLAEYVHLLEKSPGRMEYIHGFEDIANRHGLYRANGGNGKEQKNQGENQEPKYTGMKKFIEWAFEDPTGKWWRPFILAGAIFFALITIVELLRLLF